MIKSKIQNKIQHGATIRKKLSLLKIKIKIEKSKNR